MTNGRTETGQAVFTTTETGSWASTFLTEHGGAVKRDPAALTQDVAATATFGCAISLVVARKQALAVSSTLTPAIALLAVTNQTLAVTPTFTCAISQVLTRVEPPANHPWQQMVSPPRVEGRRLRYETEASLHLDAVMVVEFQPDLLAARQRMEDQFLLLV